MSASHNVDVLVIGGGPGGLAAAMSLSRTCRTVALFDSGVYRNAKTLVMNNVPRYDGSDPKEYRKGLLDEIKKKYADTFQYIPRKAVTLRRTEAKEGARSVFELEDDQKETWTGRKVVLATGIEDKLPPIPGFDLIWGGAAIHCVYCHGTETKGQEVAILLDPSVGPANAMTMKMFFQKFAKIQNQPITIIANGVFGEGATEPKPTPEFGMGGDILKLAKHKGFKWKLPKVVSITADQSVATDHRPAPATFHFEDQTSMTVPYVIYTPLTKTPDSALSLLSDPSMIKIKESTSQPNAMVKMAMGEIPSTGFFPKAASMQDGVYIAGNAGLFMGTVLMSQNLGALAGVGACNEIGAEDQEDALKACT